MKKKCRTYRQGDVFWYDFGDTMVEGKQMGVHPCLIISNDLFNRYSSVVNILAISSKMKDSPVHVKLPYCLEGVDSFVYCEQWVTASKSDLTEFICKVDNITLAKIVERVTFHITFRTRAGKSSKPGGES